MFQVRRDSDSDVTVQCDPYGTSVDLCNTNSVYTYVLISESNNVRE